MAAKINVCFLADKLFTLWPSFSPKGMLSRPSRPGGSVWRPAAALITEYLDGTKFARHRLAGLFRLAKVSASLRLAPTVLF